MSAQTVFERSEKKYLVPKAQWPQVVRGMAGHMQQDEYGKHTICSIYYDTPDFACAQAQLQKPDYREKLRLRSYGIPQSQDIVYLEMKKKLGKVTHKRRMGLTLAETRDYIQWGLPPCDTGQVFGEIDWFVQQNQPEAKAVICYDRVALLGIEEEELRITFDFDVRWRSECLDLAKGDWGSGLLAPGQVLMEVKANEALPLWLAHGLSEQGLFPQSCSKYLSVYEKLMDKDVMVDAG